MNFNVLLKAALVPVIGAGRFHPQTFPQEPAVPKMPAIRSVLIAGTAYEDQCGTDDGSTDDARFQLDIVSRDYDEMVAIVAQVRNALNGIDPPCRVNSSAEVFDQETKAHRGTLDITFHPSST